MNTPSAPSSPSARAVLFLPLSWLLWVFVCTVPAVRGDEPQFRILDLKTITPPEEPYCGWPTVARLQDGRLMVVWSGGREKHVCPFGQVRVMVSADQGDTWTWPRVLLDGDLDDRDAGLAVTARGSILVTTFTSLAYVPVLEKGRQGSMPAEQLVRWEAVHARFQDEAARTAELGTWMLRSTDGGRSWSGRYRCPVNSPHGPIQLRDGRLLYAGKQLWEQNARVGVAQSFDDGATWEWLAQIPARDGDDPASYHELHAVEADTGRLIVQIRNHNPAQAQESLQTESDDGGRTWTVPHSIGVWGIPSHLLRLTDGRILMTHGHRRPPIGNQARISSDQGSTWSKPLLLYTEAKSTDMGYPSTVELAPQRLLTVWYEFMPESGTSVLRQLRWAIE